MHHLVAKDSIRVVGANFLAPLCFLFIAATANAQRVAIVYGIDSYDHLGRDSQLEKAVSDATLLATTLRTLPNPFGVQLVIDKAREDCLKEFDDFLKRAKDADCALFYFAGHGLEYNGENFLLTKDTQIDGEAGTAESTKRRLGFQGIELGSVLDELESTKAGLQLVILDACRNNPLAVGKGGVTRSLGGKRGLGEVNASLGMLVSYAADAGEQANDGLFTGQLATNLTRPGLSVIEVFAATREQVHRTSSKWNEEDKALGLNFENRRVVQLPADYNKLTSAGLEFSFVGGDEPSKVEVGSLKKTIEALQKKIAELEKQSGDVSGLKGQIDKLRKRLEIAGDPSPSEKSSARSGRPEIAVFVNGVAKSLDSGYALKSDTRLVQRQGFQNFGFVIRNTGTGILELTGSPVVTLENAKKNRLDGNALTAFQVTAQPNKTKLKEGESATFTIRYAPPNKPGIRGYTVALKIACNDPDESAYRYRFYASANSTRFRSRGATPTLPPDAEVQPLDPIIE